MLLSPKTCLTLLFLILTVGCSAERDDLKRSEAIELLNAGVVMSIGVSASGWTILTLKDGRYRQNKATVVGYPKELLAACVDCSNVSRWIE